MNRFLYLVMAALMMLAVSCKNGTGVSGKIVTASNGNSIFLPAAAYRSDTFHTFIENLKGVRIKTLADTVRLSPLVEKMDEWKDYPEILYWPIQDRDSLTSVQEERLRSTIVGLGSVMTRIYTEMRRAGYKSDDSEFLLGMLNLRESI